MKKFLFLFLLLQKPYTTTNQINAAPAPKNAHEYAMQEIAKVCEGWKYKPASVTTTFSAVQIEFDKQAASVGCDGKVTLKNISEQDALLLITAELIRETRAERK